MSRNTFTCRKCKLQLASIKGVTPFRKLTVVKGIDPHYLESDRVEMICSCGHKNTFTWFSIGSIIAREETRVG